MTRGACSRRWQVEAIRDGRLTGKDLELAEHHREHSRECAAETRKLGELRQDMSSLPGLPRDALTVRRGRQRLMAAVNDSLLGSAPRRSAHWAAALALLPAAALGYALLTRHSSPELPKSSVEVRAKAGARWVLRNSAALEEVELSEGEASFDVHPHADRRVLIRLPDGELEDLGTTFEVAVHDQHTSHIAVTEGRVAVRLSNRPEFALSAGEHWERAPVVSAPPPPPADAPRPSESATIARPSEAPRASTGAHRAPVKAQFAAPGSATVAARSASAEVDSTRAEDSAYLAVVSLLRKGRNSEARAQAKAYLLRFPSGFRRVEMLNVATSTDGNP